MATWYTANIVTQGGTCDYSTLYYYQYSSSTVSSLDGWYTTHNTSSSHRVYRLGQSKTACAFLGGFANANGTGTQYVPSSGSLSNIVPSMLPSSSSFSVYLCWDGPSSATLSKTDLSGGPPYIFHDSVTGNLYDDASMSTPLPATTVQEGGQSVLAWGPVALPAKECYAFRGFFSASNNTGTLYIDANGYVRQSLVDALAATTANDSLTIYAKGEEVSRKLTLSPNGGSGGWSAIYNSLADRSKWYADSLCGGEPVVSVPIPSRMADNRDGFVFNGYKYGSSPAVYYIDADGSLTSDLTSLTGFSGAEVRAKWLDTSKMTVDANGGSGGDGYFYWCDYRSAYFRAIGDVLAETTSIVPPSRPGYAFAGLYTAATGGTPKVAADGTIASGLTSATTLFAQWTRTAYAVAFVGAPETLPTFYVKAAGGGLYRDAGCEEAVESGDLLWDAPPTKDGYVFLGVFASDSSSSTRYATSTGAATADFAAISAEDDVTVYCVYGALQPLTFDDAGGTGGPGTLWYLEHELYFDSIGETVATWPLASLPTRECFAFLGYFDGAGETQYIGAGGAETQALSDLVSAGIAEPFALFAQWTRRTWRVTLDEYGTAYSLAGGAVGWTSDPGGANAITSVPVPTREGYVFLGYFTVGGVQAVDITGSVVEFVGGGGDVYLDARWNAVTCTLSFSDGSASKSVTFGVAIGTLPTPSVPAPSGTVFYGWRVFGVIVTAATEWRWTEDATAEAVFGKPRSAGFGDLTDWFHIASSALVVETSESGDGKRRTCVTNATWKNGSQSGGAGRYSSGVSDIGGTWRNPTVTYRVCADTTVSLSLGTAYRPRNAAGAEVLPGNPGVAVSGFMITSVRISTAAGAFPTVTVTATANEGADAINKFAVSVPVKARARAQNLLGAISGGGEMQTCDLVASCAAVVCAENNMPCASDVVQGRYAVSAMLYAPGGEGAPTADNGFASVGEPKACGGVDYSAWSIMAEKEIV